MLVVKCQADAVLREGAPQAKLGESAPRAVDFADSGTIAKRQGLGGRLRIVVPRLFGIGVKRIVGSGKPLAMLIGIVWFDWLVVFTLFIGQLMVEQLVDILYAVAVDALMTPVAPKESVSKVTPLLVMSCGFCADSGIDVSVVLLNGNGCVAPTLRHIVVNGILIGLWNPVARAMHLATADVLWLCAVERIGVCADIDELTIAGILACIALITADAHGRTPVVIRHGAVLCDVFYRLRHPQIVVASG